MNQFGFSTLKYVKLRVYRKNFFKLKNTQKYVITLCVKLRKQKNNKEILKRYRVVAPGQTDGQTDRITIANTRCSYASSRA